MIFILTLFAIRISWTDLKYRKIKNVEVAILALYVLLIAPDISWLPFVLLTASILAIVLAFPRILGMGDVKLILALSPLMLTSGTFWYWQSLSWTLAGCYVLGNRIVCLTLPKEIAFAPFLFLGFFLAFGAK